jgi:hypothetical protein
MDVVNQLTAGDLVQLAPDKKGNVLVQTMAGEHFGDVESRLGQRLVKLLDGGNEYVTAISSLHEDGVKLFIRETRQGASQAGKLSFPATITESARPNGKRSPGRSAGDDSALDDPDEADDVAAGDDGSDSTAEGSLKPGARGRLPGADGGDENDD